MHTPTGDVHEPCTGALQEVAAHWGHAACDRHWLPPPGKRMQLWVKLGAARAPRGSFAWCFAHTRSWQWLEGTVDIPTSKKGISFCGSFSLWTQRSEVGSTHQSYCQP